MGFLSFFLREKATSANVAKNRLQVILALERTGRGPSYLQDLQRELMEVISKYVKIDQSDVKVEIERQDNFEVLQIKIELPEVRR